MWCHPSWLRPKSVLKYIRIDAAPTMRAIALDEVAGRVWLIHDSGMWCEGEILAKGAYFFVALFG